MENLHLNIKNKHIELDTTDKAIIKSYKYIAKGIANLFGKYCEVVVHSLEKYENAVVFIENGHNSGRSEGAPITDLGLKIINNNEFEFLKPYKSNFPNGNRCKSITIPIKNNNKLIGLLCINLNIEISLLDFAKYIVSNDDSEHEITESYSSNIDEMMKSILDKNIEDIILDRLIPNQEKNKKIILKLQEVGFFQLKGSVDVLAKKLKISPHTIYSNIKKYI